MLSEFPNLFGAQQLGRPIGGGGPWGYPAWERWGAVWQQCTHTPATKVLAGNKTMVPRPNQYLDSRLGKILPNTGWVINSSALQRGGIFLNRKVTSGYPSTAGTPASTLTRYTVVVGAAFTVLGEPVILIIWRSHEVDVAMTELFGGSPHFYHGYNEVFPLTPATSGEHSITSIILNHFNFSVVATAHGQPND